MGHTRTRGRTARFLEALAELGGVKAACRRAGVGRSTVYRLRATSSDFARRWDDAQDEAVDALEGELMTRAMDRTDPASAQLLMFALRALRPERYREVDMRKLAAAIEGARRSAEGPKLAAG